MSDTFDHEGDAWDSLNDQDDEDCGASYLPRPPPRCHTCGSVCYWIQENGKWQLNERGQRHVCPPRDNNPEGFE